MGALVETERCGVCSGPGRFREDTTQQCPDGAGWGSLYPRVTSLNIRKGKQRLTRLSGRAE